MRKTLLVAAAAAGLATVTAGVLHAQAGAPAPAVNPANVAAGTYATDPGHSIVGWDVSHFGFNDYYGMFGDVAGTLTIDPANIGATTLDVTIPTASVVVPSAGLKDHLLRAGRDGGAPDFFGPDPAPARFVSTAVHQTGPTTAHVMGNLTLNGVTKPVTVQAELVGMGTNRMNQKNTIGFHGTASIKRSEWNMAWGIPFGIGDEVDLRITIAFEKQ